MDYYYLAFDAEGGKTQYHCQGRGGFARPSHACSTGGCAEQSQREDVVPKISQRDQEKQVATDFRYNAPKDGSDKMSGWLRRGCNLTAIFFPHGKNCSSGACGVEVED